MGGWGMWGRRGEEREGGGEEGVTDGLSVRA